MRYMWRAGFILSVILMGTGIALFIACWVMVFKGFAISLFVGARLSYLLLVAILYMFVTRKVIYWMLDVMRAIQKRWEDR